MKAQVDDVILRVNGEWHLEGTPLHQGDQIEIWDDLWMAGRLELGPQGLKFWASQHPLATPLHAGMRAQRIVRGRPTRCAEERERAGRERERLHAAARAGQAARRTLFRMPKTELRMKPDGSDATRATTGCPPVAASQAIWSMWKVVDPTGLNQTSIMDLPPDSLCDARDIADCTVEAPDTAETRTIDRLRTELQEVYAMLGQMLQIQDNGQVLTHPTRTDIGQAITRLLFVEASAKSLCEGMDLPNLVAVGHAVQKHAPWSGRTTCDASGTLEVIVAWLDTYATRHEEVGMYAIAHAIRNAMTEIHQGYVVSRQP